MSAPAPDTPGDLSTQSADAVPIETMPRDGSQDATAVVEQVDTQGDQLPLRRPYTQTVSMPAPPDDWEFNKFLLDVAENIDANGGLQVMKDMLRGNEGIGLKVLEETKTSGELFRVLRQRMYIHRYNVVYLQALIRLLKRPELDRLAIEFSRKMGNVVYFFPASEEPLNGYRNFQVHVEGTDFTTYKRTDITELLQTISRLLFLPIGDVLIAGIEPSSSLIVTIMIPEAHAEYLCEMIEAGIPELTKLGVDALKICNITYNLHGVEEAEVETEQQRRLVNVYKQLAEMTRQLEEREVECLKLHRELERYASSNELNAYLLGASAHEHYVAQQQRAKVLSQQQTMTVPLLAKQSALSYFRFCLKTAEQKHYDKDILVQLLDSQAKVIDTRIREDYTFRIQQLHLIVQSLESKLFQLAYERDIAYLRSDPTVFGKLQDLLQRLVPPLQHVQVSLDPSYAILLRTVSKSLRYKERKNLIQKYGLNENDQTKDNIEKDRDAILECIVLNDVLKKGRIFTNDEMAHFVSDILIGVNRSDLKKKFLDLVSKQSRPVQLSKQQLAMSYKQQQQQQQQQQREQQQQIPTAAPFATTSNIEDTVNKILERVENIDSVIQDTRNRYNYDGLLGKDRLFDQSSLSPMMYAP